MANDDHDFEVRIRPGLDDDGACLVSVRFSADDRRADGRFVSPFSDDEVDQALTWMEQGLFDDRFVREFGGRLFDALFTGQIRDVYRAVRRDGDGQLRLRLVIDDPAAARIPWELLYDPAADAFPALQAPLVRGVSVTEPTRPLQTEPPLRILVVDAFPRGVLRVEGQAEAAGIRRVLAPLIRSRRLEVTSLPHVTLAGLQKVLREAADPAASRPFHLLHYIGHARHDQRAGRTVLLFEDADGDVDEVDAEALANVLSGFDVRLVFLNGCQTMHLSALDAARAFAPALLRIGVPVVIGMQVTVLDEVAVRFSREFYAALADNRPVDLAMLDARRLIRGHQERRRADMGIPVCYLRTATGVIFEVLSTARVPLTWSTWRRWTRQRLTLRLVAGALAGLIGVSSGVLSWAQFVAPRLQSPARMTGDFNIAVADFAGIDRSGRLVRSAEASALAQSMYRTLETELASLGADGFDIEVRAPTETEKVGGAKRTQRAEAAADVAGEINADVVVYGALAADARSFTPEFFVSARKLPGAEELVGQYELGSPLTSAADITANPAARKQLRDRLQARTAALARFVIGLGYYSIDGFAQASAHFEAAATVTGWDDRDGREVLYLFLGNAAGKQNRLAAADSFYRQALQLNPGYSRAMVGQAEVRFQQARGTCEDRHADRDGLTAALRIYRRALAAPDQPALSDVPTKVRFGVGRAYLCLSQAGLDDRWMDAAHEFRSVIAEFDRGNQRVQDLAAESHAGLALVSLPAQGEAGAESEYRSAAREYASAIRLTSHPDRRELFSRQLRHPCRRLEALGSTDPACAAARTP